MRVRAAELLTQAGAGAGVAERMRPATPGADVDDAAWHATIAPPFSRAYLEPRRARSRSSCPCWTRRTVRNFVTLARKGFFDGLPVHRVVPDFVIQGGDPRRRPGGPATIRDEINRLPTAAPSAWRSTGDTGGSQFFITHSPAPHLDGRYTVFGRGGRDGRGGPCDAGDRIVRVTIQDGVTD
jgi:peptidyl-prolyl cis-trans isomerase B (cyclophilin B)